MKYFFMKYIFILSIFCLNVVNASFITGDKALPTVVSKKIGHGVYCVDIYDLSTSPFLSIHISEAHTDRPVLAITNYRGERSYNYFAYALNMLPDMQRELAGATFPKTKVSIYNFKNHGNKSIFANTFEKQIPMQRYNGFIEYIVDKKDFPFIPPVFRKESLDYKK